MAKNLVIVESPTKAKTIKRFLGRNYKVLASVGHVRDLPKSRFAIDIEDNFEPEYINIRGKAPIINEIKKEAKKADRVYLATDNDREGEAISWHLSYLLDMDEDAKNRISFNEVTKDAVKESLENPRAIDKDLVDAQQGRRVLDRLVGYQISPILWKKIRGGLSAGRVQSAVVKLICDREEEIEEFVPEEYWSLQAELKAQGGLFVADYYGHEVSGKEEKVKIPNKEALDKILGKIDRGNFQVSNIKKGTRTRNPRPPFTTSTMQQEASNSIGFAGRKTMTIAQQLYEGIKLEKETTGLITYMRTDSTNVSKTARDQAYSYILARFGKEYTNTLRKYGSAKDAQEAHECIRPTDINLTPYQVKDYLSADQFKLYRLIWERFMASMMASAKYETLNIRIDSNRQIFKASGSNITFEGFLALDRKEDQKKDENILPSIKEDEKLTLKDLVENQHFTRPPARYSEASLIKELEELGIGRPSTYAPTISTILGRNYVELEDRRFVPTDLGIVVNEVLTDYFPTITDKEFTAKLEDELDNVEEGKTYWKDVIGEFYQGFEKNLKEAEAMEELDIQDQETDEICEKCGRNMVIKNGRFGKFLACPGYPECKNTKSFLDKIGVECNQCEDGQIIRKRTKNYRYFYGCSNYPECDFASWTEPIQYDCPECGSLMTKPNSKKADHYICSNQECKHKIDKDQIDKELKEKTEDKETDQTKPSA